MTIQTAVRTVIQSAPAEVCLTPSALLSKVNAVLRHNMRKIGEEQYITAMAVRVRGPAVTYSGLHQDILVYRAASGVVERVETRGMWIGPVEDVSALLADDTLEMNDGDVNAPLQRRAHRGEGGRQEGRHTRGDSAAFQRLAAAERDPSAVVQGLQGLLGGRAPSDDVTLMVVRYAPGGAVR